MVRCLLGIVAAATLTLGACSSAGTSSDNRTVPFDAVPFCTKVLGECGQQGMTQADCVANYSAVVISPACASQMKTATCAQLLGSDLDAVCTPSCSPAGGYACDGAFINACSSNAQSLRIDCAKLCASRKLTFDHCGTGSSLGHDACLCK